ncbi:MAG: hypothetical protein J3K34DRAFT_440884 [Monoraphidium minutum]|nr:MAG: hypothetical protein J3K34DRAFT_440884 [Monoraphidium minutum]
MRWRPPPRARPAAAASAWRRSARSEGARAPPAAFPPPLAAAARPASACVVRSCTRRGGPCAVPAACARERMPLLRGCQRSRACRLATVFHHVQPLIHSHRPSRGGARPRQHPPPLAHAPPRVQAPRSHPRMPHLALPPRGALWRAAAAGWAPPSPLLLTCRSTWPGRAAPCSPGPLMQMERMSHDAPARAHAARRAPVLASAPTHASCSKLRCPTRHPPTLPPAALLWRPP